MSGIILRVLSQLATCGVLGFVAYIMWLTVKVVVTNMICKHPELSDDKVKHITNMIAKNKHHKFN